MTSAEMNNAKAVEVDGVCFETIMLDRVLPIPAIKPGAFTPVQLGIRITNNTLSRLRFGFFDGFLMLPELVALDGQTLRRGYACERRLVPRESDFILTMPGEALIFYPKVLLYWQQNPKKKRERKLTLSISFEDSDFFIYESLNPGVYQVQFVYKQSCTEMEAYYKYCIKPTILQEVWTGKVVTPPVEFCLLQP